MLREFPVYFNGTEIPRGDKWDESYETVEEVNQTEAGTDQVVLVRSGKLTVSAEYSCSSALAGRLASFRDIEPITVKMYDLKAQGYTTRTMRIRNFSASVVEDSKNTRGTTGLWNVSFNLMEY